MPDYEDFERGLEHDDLDDFHPEPPHHHHHGGPFPGRNYDLDTYVKHYARILNEEDDNDGGGSLGLRATLRFLWNTALIRFIVYLFAGASALELIYIGILFLCGVRN
ncbi:MAG: hypothetical protein HFJ17_01030 [Clostridia bacterium]|nr:hypothetical protein [Clostridia bacterium]